MKCDRLIIGAGLYGLYSALYSVKKGYKVVVLEMDDKPFNRATYINQARVHNGYHYPRSISTALKSKKYFDKFCEDYPESIKSDFTQIYATSKNFSLSNKEQFKKFCEVNDLRCDSVTNETYFKDDMCDGTFITTEYTYDAHILKDNILNELKQYSNLIEIVYSCNIKSIIKEEDKYKIELSDNTYYTAPFVLNSSYASVNQINVLANFETLPIKYELCEIIICKVSDKFKDIGFTVMDGPFFSIMPVGKTGYHSLTSVTFTPHQTSYSSLPTFTCQKGNEEYCNPYRLGNCNECKNKPKSSWSYMSQLARKYLKDEYKFEYVESLFSMKPILKVSEIDDSRPTLIKVYSKSPTFISVLSGKINTVYDLQEVLDDEY